LFIFIHVGFTKEALKKDMKMVVKIIILALVMGGIATPIEVYAGQDSRERRAQQRDQDKALGARKATKLIAYGRIKQKAQREFNGRVVGQNLLEMRKGQWAYVLKILQKGGEVKTVIINAHNGNIISRGGS